MDLVVKQITNKIMKQIFRTLRYVWLALLPAVILLAACAPAMPPGAAETQAALVQALETARAQPTAASTTVPIATALPPDVVDMGGAELVKLSGEVRSGRSLLVQLDGGSQIVFSAGSVFTISEFGTDPANAKTRVQLDMGEVYVALKGGSLDVITPSGSASVSGSLLGITLVPGSTELVATCMEGVVILQREGVEVTVPPGQRAAVSNENPAPAVGGAMAPAELAGWAVNVTASIEVMTTLVSAEQLVAMAGALPMGDARGAAALGTLVEQVSPDTLGLMVNALPAATLGTALQVLEARAPDNPKLAEMLAIVPEAKLGGIVEALASTPAGSAAAMSVVAQLPPERLAAAVGQMSPQGVGTMVGMLGAPERAATLKNLVAAVPEANMATLVVALSQDPARAEQAKALTFVLPPERLLKALEAVSARPDAAAVLGNLTTVIPKEQFDSALAAPGAQPGSVLGNAVDAIKNLIAPPAESAAPAQPVQPGQAPAQPAQPGQAPAQPVQPPKPGQVPAQPVQPVQPPKPGQVPAQPVQPPAQPVQPQPGPATAPPQFVGTASP